MQTWSAGQFFNDGDLILNGSSSGAGTLHAPAAASSYSWVLPAANATLASVANINTALPSITTSQLYGGTGGAGVAQGITLGTGLSMSGTTLNASGAGGGTGGVVVKTGNYTLNASEQDNNLVVEMYCSSACTLTIPSSPTVPFATYMLTLCRPERAQCRLPSLVRRLSTLALEVHRSISQQSIAVPIFTITAGLPERRLQMIGW